MNRLFNAFGLSLLIGIGSSPVWAIQAQPVPIPEEPSAAPQVEVDGVSIGTLAGGRPLGVPGVENGLNFSDSALFLGAAQRLYRGAVGSFGLGGLLTDEAASGSPFFLYQAFADYQSQNLEVLLGRTDNRTAHVVDFPTLRGDDLITLTNPLDPFSNGRNPEEHRYANVGSLTLNQGLATFEDVHVQHLLDSAGPGGDAGINSVGARFEYLGPPGMEAFGRFPSWGFGYEYLPPYDTLTTGLHQLYAGGVMNLNESVTDRWDLRAQEVLSLGSSLTSFNDAADSFRANSNGLAMSLRYLHSPFGGPGYQVALTTGAKNYLLVPETSWGWALTGVKQLGQGFDLVAQYQGQWRSASLARVQSPGADTVHMVEAGLLFNFGAAFNQHLPPRRSLLNQRHQYLPR